MSGLKSHEELLSDLRRLTQQADPAALSSYLQDNLTALFASPSMAEYYELIRSTAIAHAVAENTPTLTRLIVAWLAFLCGDNVSMSTVVATISDEDVSNPQEASFRYALLALCGIVADPEERRRLASLSIEVLPANDSSIFMANAKLTHAQILAGSEQYRAAAGLFAEAYRLFLGLRMSFPAAVALTNELLNRYRIGQLLEVIEKGEQALAMSSSFRGDRPDYWNILHLPLGMCQLELNKANLAVQSLRLAQDAIAKMGLLHMHGLIEYFLFKAYYVLGDQAGLMEVLDTVERTLGHMQGYATELLVSVFRALARERQVQGAQGVQGMQGVPEVQRALGAPERQAVQGVQEKQQALGVPERQAAQAILQSDIDRLEVAYLREKAGANWILLEALAYLRVRGLSAAVSADDVAEYIKRLRYTGMIPLVQLFLVFLAEMNYQENNLTDAVSCLEEAVAISKEHGITVHLHTYPLECLSLLRTIDERLYKSVAAKGLLRGPSPQREPLLSAKEREILELIALGKSNADISQILFVSVGTVKWHINHILSKLDARNRTEAVQKGKALGEIS